MRLFTLFLSLQGEVKGEQHLTKWRLLGDRKEAFFSKPWHVAHSHSPPHSSCQQHKCSLLAFPLPLISADLTKPCFSPVVAFFPCSFAKTEHVPVLWFRLQGWLGRGAFSTGRAPAGDSARSAGIATSGGVDAKHLMLSVKWEMFTN